VEQLHIASPNLYAIGSRSRSLIRFSCLLVSAVGTLAILYLVILQFIRHVLGDGPEDTFFTTLILAGGILVVLFDAFLFRRISGWVAFAMKDSAAGFVGAAGLRYKIFLNWHTVPWRDISRIEYFAAENGRTHFYRLGFHHFPIRFGPSNETARRPILAGFLKNQAQTSKGVFIEHTSSALRESSAPVTKTHINRNREVVAKVLLRLSALVWFGYSGLFYYYSYTRPRLTEVSEGRIYMQNNRGYVTYLTANEHNLLHVLEFSAPILLLAGVLLDPRRRIWQRSKS
jgi:hypothetical protein